MSSLKKIFAVALCTGAIAFAAVRIYTGFFTVEAQPEYLRPLDIGPLAEGFDPMIVVPMFPPIEDAPFITATEVDDQVHDEELVLGVEIDGEAKAYPINMMTQPTREIVNDSVGGVHFAATW